MILSKPSILSWLLIFKVLLWMPAGYAGEIIPTDKESFAQEYEYLGVLLEKVRNKESAIAYKPKIISELARIQSSIGKQSDYESLSPLEKKLFVSKFQNNNLHCGFVTKVMDERNRLLLNKEIKSELGDVLDQLIQ
jgi:Lhr-like helicase